MTSLRNALLPQDDPDQSLRMRRFLLGSATYVMNATFVLFCWHMSYLPTGAVAVYFGLVAAINAGVYLLLRTGLNLRFRDPSLTFLQMALGAVTGFHLMLFAADARPVFLLLGVAMCVFGMFRFKARDFIALSAFILAGYAVVILLVWRFRSDEIDLRVDLLIWMALLITLSQFSFLASHIQRLRRKLRESHHALAERNGELETALRRISDMAVRDELTGAYNRRYLTERIAEEAQRCKRNGASFCIAILDIDFFKNINDTYGHPAGDSVLRSVSATAADALRQTDFFGRFGGEEFLMVLTDTTLEGALLSAERVRAKVEALRFPDIDGQLTVTISIGVAEHSRQADPAQTLKRADDALYRAKQGGRNRSLAA